MSTSLWIDELTSCSSFGGEDDGDPQCSMSSDIEMYSSVAEMAFLASHSSDATFVQGSIFLQRSSDP